MGGAEFERVRARLLTLADLPGLVLLVGVALGLRAPNLTTLGLYRDDAWPALAVEASLSETLRLGVTTPGFELFLRGWLSVSRATPWAQAPALVASILAVVGVYLLARQLGCGRVAATAAGGVLVLSPASILFATRVKPYQIDGLATVALIAAALVVAERPGSAKRWALLGLLSVVAAVFSASTLAVSASAIAWCAVVSRRQPSRRGRRLGLLVPLAFVALAGTYAGFVLDDVPPSLQSSWSLNFISLESPGELVRSTAAVIGSFAAGVLPTTEVLASVVLVVVAALALWSRPRIAALAAAPVLVALGLALVQRAPFGGGRIDIYLYPCVAVLAALAIQRVLDTGLVPGRLAGAGLALGLVAFTATYGLDFVRANPYPGVEMGPLAATVRARMEPGDALVVGSFSRYPFALYALDDPDIVLSSRYAPGFTVRSDDPDVLIMPAEFFEDGYEAELAVRFARERSRVWYIATDTPASDTDPVVQAFEYEPEQRLVNDGFAVVDRIDAHGVHADLLVRPLRPPPGGAGPRGAR